MSFGKEDIYTDIQKEVTLKEFNKNPFTRTVDYIYLTIPMEINTNNGKYISIEQKGNDLTLIRHIEEELKDKVIHSSLKTIIHNVRFDLSYIRKEKDLIHNLINSDGEIRLKCTNPDMLRLLLNQKKEDHDLLIEYYPSSDSDLLKKKGLRAEYITYKLRKPVKNGYMKVIYELNQRKVFESNIQRDILIIPVNNRYICYDTYTNPDEE